MKILYLITRLNIGGATRHVVWVHAGARSAGHDCHMVAGMIPPGEGDMEYLAIERGTQAMTLRERKIISG
jgi:hypothetical protein